MPKGLIFESEDGETFKRVGLFAFRDVEDIAVSEADLEAAGGEVAFDESVEAEKKAFFEGCEVRNVVIV